MASKSESSPDTIAPFERRDRPVEAEVVARPRVAVMLAREEVEVERGRLEVLLASGRLSSEANAGCG